MLGRLAGSVLQSPAWVTARTFHATSAALRPIVGPDGVSRKVAVVALGGNALLKRGEPMTIENQARNARVAAEAISKLITEEGLCVCITHGNGPQVGLLAVESPNTPLDVLDSESEGSIGYVVENEMANLLPNMDIATVLTQVVVDPRDTAFQAPSKFIGKHYSKEEAEKLTREKGWVCKVDGKHGPRRVVPSPAPKDIVEIRPIQLLLSNNIITICCGGGGIPVMRDEKGKKSGVEAVVDKDAASALLAQKIKADMFVVLTDAHAVLDPQRWPQEEVPLPSPARASDLRKMSFPAGSMGPKVSAVCDYVEATGGMGAIGSLADALEIVRGTKGTQIVR
eukprot:comp22287_c0_seq1/m.33033 comp22287_c0_seq1/g.33033  ORF comp22287_c0_seq1/g.33033 comp22287_c0_seq1/m.33033 type:complete len:339 (-) comp22287_c0_seq1:61-1077(-)